MSSVFLLAVPANSEMKVVTGSLLLISLEYLDLIHISSSTSVRSTLAVNLDWYSLVESVMSTTKDCKREAKIHSIFNAIALSEMETYDWSLDIRDERWFKF